MEICIYSNCLSLVMRDFNDELITEICIIGLKFSQVSYLNGRSIMSVICGTMFMFHDEITESNLK